MGQSVLKCLIYTKTFFSPLTLISAPEKNTPFLPSFTQYLDFAEVFVGGEWFIETLFEDSGNVKKGV